MPYIQHFYFWPFETKTTPGAENASYIAAKWDIANSKTVLPSDAFSYVISEGGF